MKKYLSILAGLLFFVGLLAPAPAAHIIWVTRNFDTADTPASPNDSGWTDLLTAHGHTVDRRVITALDTDDAACLELNAADLIIISRDGISGTYVSNAEELQRWNGLTTPMINFHAFVARFTVWRWFASNQTSVVGPLRAEEPDHAIFEGVSLDGSNQVLIHETSMNTLSFGSGNGIELAVDAANDRPWIVYWEPGVEYFSGSGQITGGPRLFFAAGGNSIPTQSGAENFNAEGERLFLNAVDFMLGQPRLK
ncbi:MAG: hypothetical protein AAF492_09945, partial [Verrucomicrobiota bacterium]